MEQSRVPRGTGIYDYTWPCFYKTLCCVIVYFRESKCPSSPMPVQNLENRPWCSNCGWSKQEQDLPSTFWLFAALVGLPLAQNWAECHLCREIWYCFALVNLTHSATFFLTAACFARLINQKSELSVTK